MLGILAVAVKVPVNLQDIGVVQQSLEYIVAKWASK
jgi:hypothetical protein